MANRLVVVTFNFRYPIALSALGQSVTFLGSYIVCDVLHWAEPPGPGVTTDFFLRWIVPIGVAQGIGIVLSNKLYLYLTVAFLEMSRSLMPLLTMIALHVVGLEVPTLPQVAMALVCSLGSCISAWGEASLSVPGLTIMSAGFAIEILRMIMVQYMMQSQKLDPWQTVRLMSLPAAISLSVLTLLFEAQTMVRAGAVRIITAHLPAFVLAASLGLAVNYASTLIVKLSGATTMKLLAGVRGPLVVLAAVMMFAEKASKGLEG